MTTGVRSLGSSTGREDPPVIPTWITKPLPLLSLDMAWVPGRVQGGLVEESALAGSPTRKLIRDVGRLEAAVHPIT